MSLKRKKPVRTPPRGHTGGRLREVAAPKNAPRMVWAEAGSLSDNPANWRTHPAEQKRALKAVMGDVGWAGVLLYNERTGRLIDGHARKAGVKAGTPVPVLVGNWSEEQEKKILLTLDPLAAMALPDPAQLDKLLAEVDLSEAAMAPLLEGLQGQIEALEKGLGAEEGTEAQRHEGTKGKGKAGGGDAGAEKLASSFQVIAVCEDEEQQETVFEMLKKAGVDCRLNTLY